MANFRVETQPFRANISDTNVRVIKIPSDKKNISSALEYIKAVRRNKESFVIQVSPGEYKEDIKIIRMDTEISIQGVGIYPTQTKLKGNITVILDDNAKDTKSSDYYDLKELSLSNLYIEGNITVEKGNLYLEKAIVSNSNDAINLLESRLTCHFCELENTVACRPTINAIKSNVILTSCNVDNKSFESPSLIFNICESILVASQSALYGSIKSNGGCTIEIRNSQIIVDTEGDDTDVFITSENDEVHLYYSMISGDTEYIKTGPGKSVRAGVTALSKAKKFAGGDNIVLNFV